MRVLFGMPAQDSWGGPIASEPPFVAAVRGLGVDVSESVYVYGDKGTLTPLFKRFERVIKTAFKFRKLLSKGGFDIVHLNTAFDLRTILRDSFSIFVMRPGNTKVFLKLHGSEAESFTKADWFVRQLIRYLDRHVDAIGVHTHEERDAMVELGFDLGKFYFVKNAINLGASDQTVTAAIAERQERNAIKLLFASRFIPTKGLIETISALKILVGDFGNIDLACVGDGEMKGPAEDLVKELGLGHHVRFTGYIPERDVMTQLLDGDILVFPTRHPEGFPNILFKAAAAGMAIVTTPVRAAAEYLSDPANCLYCSQDPEDIAAKLRILIENVELRKQMSENNFDLGKTLSPKRVAEEYLVIYNSILSDPNGEPGIPR